MQSRHFCKLQKAVALHCQNFFFQIGKPHPDPVVETASMASVEPPDVWYELHLPEATIDEGKLSALQLEAITYACQQHNHILPNGDRAGFLIGKTINKLKALRGCSYIDGSRAVVVWILAKVLKNVNVTTIMFLMSGDLTGLCLYITCLCNCI